MNYAENTRSTILTTNISVDNSDFIESLSLQRVNRNSHFYESTLRPLHTHVVDVVVAAAV